LKKRSALLTNSVFLNLPFDREYEEIFVGNVVGLITLGLEPRSVIELDETGEGRMERLFRLMGKCGSSIHDLSYRGDEFRYNMPFELGIAFALGRSGGKRRLVVFEAKKRDLLRTLTDLRGFDPKIHSMKGKKALAMIYECFISPTISDPEKMGQEIYDRVILALPGFRCGRPTIFNRRSFQLLIHFTSHRVEALKAKS
jgi:hypothetical protein